MTGRLLVRQLLVLVRFCAWQDLADALRDHAARHDGTLAEQTPFGMRYAVEGWMQTPDGRKPLIHRHAAGYEVEFVALDGETIGVVTVLASQVRPVGQREIAHARLVSVPA